jgi:hypothetical protein
MNRRWHIFSDNLNLSFYLVLPVKTKMLKVYIFFNLVVNKLVMRIFSIKKQTRIND